MLISRVGAVLFTCCCATAGVACSSSSSNDVGGDAATDASAYDGPSMDSGSDSSGDSGGDAHGGACHAVVNEAPTVQATIVQAPFPTGVGQGGEFASGKYYLTSVVYYQAPDAGADAGDASGDAGGPSSRYWKTTIDLQVTLGALASRTWHFGHLPDLSDLPEHREIVSFDVASPTTINFHSVCSDLPVQSIAEYTATPTQFIVWFSEPGRVETYTKQ